jgi:hypothetical protein
MPLAGRNPRILGWALSQLSIVTGFPAGVLILNQSRNHHRPLAAYADIVIEMEIPRGPEMTRRRTFRGVGRYPETLQTATAELNAAGTDYILADADAPPRPLLLTTLQTLLGASSTPLSRQEILCRWPQSEPPPRGDSLCRCLARGCETGLFVRSGGGTKTEAFRYGVREMEVLAGK